MDMVMNMQMIMVMVINMQTVLCMGLSGVL